MRAVTTAVGAISISSPVISPSASPLPKIGVPLLMQDRAVAPVGSIAIESHLPSTPLKFVSHRHLHSIQREAAISQPRSGAAVQHMGRVSGKIKRASCTSSLGYGTERVQSSTI